MLVSKLVLINEYDKEEAIFLLNNSLDNRLILQHNENIILNIQYNDDFFDINHKIFKIISPEEALEYCKIKGIDAKIINGQLFYRMLGQGSRIGRNGVEYKNSRPVIRLKAE